MSEFDMDALVDRLRGLTGQTAGVAASTSAAAATATAAAAAAAKTRVSEETLLALQQSLRRHPALQLLSATRREAMRELLLEMDGALQVPRSDNAAAAAGADKAPQDSASSPASVWLTWVNEVAEELEKERLGAVYGDVPAVMRAAQEDALAELGFDEAPLLSQNQGSFLCPWNVLFSLVAGPLFEHTALRTYGRAALRVPNATAAMQANMQCIQADCHDGAAWLALLRQLKDFPIAAVRNVWQAALYLFPTAGTLVCGYARRELDELRQQPRLAECADEADLRSVYTVHLRLLNLFYRHLTIGFSCELYTLFFDLLSDFVQPDQASLDSLYRTCLRRDVGQLPQSTPLWTRYLAWRSAYFHDAGRRREWRRQLYHRMLQLPLHGLDKVKEEYDSFIATDYRNRVAPEEKAEVEKRLVRVKAEVGELMKYAAAFALSNGTLTSSPSASNATHSSNTSSHTRVVQSLPRPLPRTLSLCPDDILVPTTASVAGEELSLKSEAAAVAEVASWVVWDALLEQVSRPLFPSAAGASSAMAVLQHYARRRVFLKMRACAFPHHLNAWTAWIDFCAYEQPVLPEKERQAFVVDAIDTASFFLHRHACMHLYAAEVQNTVLHQREEAVRHVHVALLQARGALREFVRRDESGLRAEREAVLRQLQDVVMLAVNWMRLAVTQSSERHQLRLIARYVMHHIDHLSLTMTLLRKLLRGNAIDNPAPYLRPFNVFCHEWIRLELMRNRAPDAALAVLRQWKEHLKLLLRSAKERRWSVTMCGVDDLFLTSCEDIIIAAGARCGDVLAALGELEAAAQTLYAEMATERAIREANGRFLYLCAQLRHRFFAAYTVATMPLRGCDGVSTKLLYCYAAPQRYDTTPFASPLWSAAEREMLLAGGLSAHDPIAHIDPATTVETAEDAMGPQMSAQAGQSSRAKAEEEEREAMTSMPSVYPDERQWCATTEATSRPLGTTRANNYTTTGGNSNNNMNRARRRRAMAAEETTHAAGGAAGLPRNARKAGGKEGAGRAVVAFSVTLPTLAECLAEIASEADTSSTAPQQQQQQHKAARHTSAMPAVNALQELIETLPTVYEYTCDGAADDALSTDWLLNKLCTVQALR